MNSNQKGAIAEAAIAFHAVKQGIEVLRPVAEHCRYDLAFDLGERMIRVQCKWAPRRGDVVQVHLAGYRLTPHGQVRSTYGEHEIDAVAVYCDDLDRVYVLPAALVAHKTAVRLRLERPKNGQRASINWADEFTLGAIAQLGERLRGTQEVAGSSPASSTPQADDTEAPETAVGAHEFRNLFGHFMERAAAGERILVTRRGRPMVRLAPA
jgi:prevent-host-death family protein